AIAKECFGRELSPAYGIGQIFLSHDSPRAAAARTAVENCLAAEGLSAVGWRVVPTDKNVLGSIASASLPHIEQVFIDADNFSEEKLRTALFLARRKAELALRDDADFYICSLSNTVLTYKGLMMPADLSRFY